MQKIDIHNYEAYLLDFSEGNLSDELQMELELFLIQHPELEINLDELTLVTLERDSIAFSNKNSLKKSEVDLVSENQFIAYIENQLPENERLDVEKSCAINTTLSKELALYTSTLASPDTSIIFENKQSLKRKPKVIWFDFSVTQYAAACVIFVLGLFMFWPKTDVELNGLAMVNKKIVMNVNTLYASKNDLIIPKASKLSVAQQSSHPTVTTKEQSLLANNSILKESHALIIKDTTHTTSINNSIVIESPKNEPLIALNEPPVAKPKTVVQVITENDDEVVAVNTDKKKKGIWATASRALKNLNHAGVKAVNGDEEDNKDNTAYAITLGGVNITHKADL